MSKIKSPISSDLAKFPQPHTHINGPFSIPIERNDEPFHGEWIRVIWMGMRCHAAEIERGKVIVLGATFMSGIDDLILGYRIVRSRVANRPSTNQQRYHQKNQEDATFVFFYFYYLVVC